MVKQQVKNDVKYFFGEKILHLKIFQKVFIFLLFFFSKLILQVVQYFVVKFIEKLNDVNKNK